MHADSFSSSLTAASSLVDDSSSSMAAKTITAASSSDWKYDVFRSFRGEDISNNFIGHLNKALDRKGIDTFVRTLIVGTSGH